MPRWAFAQSPLAAGGVGRLQEATKLSQPEVTRPPSAAMVGGKKVGFGGEVNSNSCQWLKVKSGILVPLGESSSPKHPHGHGGAGEEGHLVQSKFKAITSKSGTRSRCI